VNGQELVGMTQEQVVKILRAVASGSIVSLTVSRQSETLPRKMVIGGLTVLGVGARDWSMRAILSIF